MLVFFNPIALRKAKIVNNLAFLSAIGLRTFCMAMLTMLVSKVYVVALGSQESNIEPCDLLVSLC